LEIDIAALQGPWEALRRVVSWLLDATREWLLLFGTLGVLITFVLNQRATARDRQRLEYAKALHAIIRWTEFPYRIHRRAIIDAPSKGQLVEAMHELQQEIAFYDAWLSVEAPMVANSYRHLVTRVKGQTGDHLQKAWDVSPTPNSTLNIGNRYPVEFTTEREAFLEQVRDHLRWFGWWERTTRLRLQEEKWYRDITLGFRELKERSSDSVSSPSISANPQRGRVELWPSKSLTQLKRSLTYRRHVLSLSLTLASLLAHSAAVP